METSSCIICSSSTNANYIEVNDRLNITSDLFQLKKCVCGFIFLDPRPSIKEIGQYYKSPNYDPHNVTSISLRNKLFKNIQLLTSFLKIKMIEKHIKKGTLLDIGGGDSVFGSTISDRGWATTVQDKFINNVNNKVSTIKDLNELKNIEKFDVITLWHSLEHIHDVEALFTNLNDLISDDGILVIAVPNFNAFERRIYGSNWAPYDAPRHLYHFTPNYLNKLLIKYGFSAIQIKSLYLDLPYNIILSMKFNIIDIIKSFLAFIISLSFNLICGPKKSSSFLFICKKI